MSLNKFRTRFAPVVLAQRTRRALLCAELCLRGLYFQVGGDGISVLIGVLWFDVYPLWGVRGWVVDHPHTDFDDEHFGWQIAHTHGVLFPVRTLFALADSGDYDI
ncbi:hypothetical protein ACWEP5_27440 [Nocardia niigatensis]